METAKVNRHADEGRKHGERPLGKRIEPLHRPWRPSGKSIPKCVEQTCSEKNVVQLNNLIA
jgi:hypothetical protein